jgi:microcystin-dependent protein
MAISIGPNGSTFNTLIPDLESDVADIQKAFRFYHYGNSNGSNIGVPGQGIWGFLTEKAPINAPTFTGIPAAPTASVGTNTTQIATTAFVAAGLAQNTPAGSIVIWAGVAAPTGWLLCQGQAISRTTYALLYSALGGASSPYGQGDGTSTFNVPNLKGRIPVGLDSAQTEFDALGETGGAKTVTLTTAQMPVHSHTNTVTSNGGVTPTGTAVNGGAHTHTASTGSAGAHTHTVTVNGDIGNLLFAKPDLGSEVFKKDTVSKTTTSSGSHSHSVTVNSGGSHTHTLSIEPIPDHSHIVTIASSGGGEPHNNLQPYIVMNYIIKA